MSNLLVDSWDTYSSNIKLVLLFSIPFIISFLIPLLAPLPTYITGGGIFLRSASIFLNVSAIGMTVIVISLFLSLLFLSFAFVAISLIVKGKRTHTRNAAGVIREVEKYTSKVFLVLLFYAFIVALTDILSYSFGLEGIATPIIGFFLFLAIFYAPTAIVIDNKRMWAAIKQSVVMVLKEPQYFIVWFVLITLVISALDFVFIGIAGVLPSSLGTLFSSYLLLIVNSLFVLPYFIIYQAEAYMKRFSLLKH
jgi:hypothetical protein